MEAILQATFSITFSWMKICVIRLRWYFNLFLSVWSTKINIGSDKGFVPTTRQVVTWTNVDQDIWKHSWFLSRWRHQIETFSELLALCQGESTGHQWISLTKPMMRSIVVFFDLPLNKRLSKLTRRRRFDTPSRSIWRHCNVYGKWFGRFRQYKNGINLICVAAELCTVKVYASCFDFCACNAKTTWQDEIWNL